MYPLSIESVLCARLVLSLYCVPAGYRVCNVCQLGTESVVCARWVLSLNCVLAGY